MSNDPSARRILPQSSQMGTFSFAPQQTPQTQKSAHPFAARALPRAVT